MPIIRSLRLSNVIFGQPEGINLKFFKLKNLVQNGAAKYIHQDLQRTYILIANNIQNVDIYI